MENRKGPRQNGVVIFRAPTALRSQLQSAAAKRGVTVSAYLRDAAERQLQEEAAA